MTEPVQVTNPLLERLRIPGETFRLPSQGQFYKNGELDDGVKNGEVEVNPMTAIDEIVINTPDKLLSGKAVLEIFQHCIPQIKNPGELLAKDVDFLLVCLRLVTFGPKMEISHDHNCSENSKEHTYAIDLQQMVRSTKQIDATTLAQTYTMTMPNGQVVRLKPLTYSSVLQLYATVALTKAENISETEAELLVVSTLVHAIESVDGIDDRELIRQWVVSLSLGWKRELEKSIRVLSQWGVDLETTHKCKDCGEEMVISVSPNPVSFFT